MKQYRISKVWVDDAHIWAETQNGWKANYPFSHWSKLANASPNMRAHRAAPSSCRGHTLFLKK